MEPTSPQTDPLAVLSLVLGIASIPLVFCYALGLPAGIAAVVLGALSLQRTRRQPAASRWQAVVGMICGAVAVIAIVIIILLPD
jgi:Na+/proline symporter